MFILIFLTGNKLISEEINLSLFKTVCSELGFIPKSDKYINCVIELHKRRKDLKIVKLKESQISNEIAQRRILRNNRNNQSNIDDILTAGLLIGGMYMLSNSFKPSIPAAPPTRTYNPPHAPHPSTIFNPYGGH